MSFATPGLRVALCIDVEPDERSCFQGGVNWRGTERLWHNLQRLRARVERETTGPAHAWWFLRMDPQIGHLHGDPGWIAQRFAGELAQVRAYGDEIGLHTHAWRRTAQGTWRCDHGDPRWVASCLDVSRAAFRDAFGQTPRVFRFGDRWMSNAVARKLARDGIRIDFTLEPGFPEQRAMRSSDDATGALPDCRGVPRAAYRPSRLDFRRPGHVWPSRLLMTPVSTACLVCARARILGVAAAPHEHRPASLNLALRPDYFGRMLDFLVGVEQRGLLVALVRSGDLGDKLLAGRAMRNLTRVLDLAGSHTLRFCGPDEFLPVDVGF